MLYPCEKINVAMATLYEEDFKKIIEEAPNMKIFF